MYETLSEAEQVLEGAWLAEGRALAAIRERELWREAPGCHSWAHYCEVRTPYAVRTADDKIQAARINDSLQDFAAATGVSVEQLKLASHHRPLAKIEDDGARLVAWLAANRYAEALEREITGRIVSAAVNVVEEAQRAGGWVEVYDQYLNLADAVAAIMTEEADEARKRSLERLHRSALERRELGPQIWRGIEALQTIETRYPDRIVVVFRINPEAHPLDPGEAPAGDPQPAEGRPSRQSRAQK